MRVVFWLNTVLAESTVIAYLIVGMTMSDPMTIITSTSGSTEPLS